MSGSVARTRVTAVGVPFCFWRTADHKMCATSPAAPPIAVPYLDGRHSSFPSPALLFLTVQQPYVDFGQYSETLVCSSPVYALLPRRKGSVLWQAGQEVYAQQQCCGVSRSGERRRFRARVCVCGASPAACISPAPSFFTSFHDIREIPHRAFFIIAMTPCDFLLSEAAWSSTCVMGALLGCAMAFFCAAIVQRLTSHHAAPKEVAASPFLSRRDRAAKRLEELRSQSATASKDRAHAAEVSTTDEDSWESATSGSSDEDSDDFDSDSEYERMEALRLKMVFIVSSRVKPKITAQEAAVLTASAGVQLVKLLQEVTKPSAAVRMPPSESLCAGESPDHQRWVQWYLWWSRIGCGKITLKCPDKETLELIVSAAQKRRLPMAVTRQSEVVLADSANDEVMPITSDAVVVALGPAPSDVLEPITGSLKLFS